MKPSKPFLTTLAAIAVIVLAVAVPNFFHARGMSAGNVYINNLRQIDAAKNQWMLEKGKTTNDLPTWNELLPCLRSSFTNYHQSNDGVVGVSGEIYTIGKVGEPPTCLANGQKINLP